MARLTIVPARLMQRFTSPCEVTATSAAIMRAVDRYASPKRLLADTPRRHSGNSVWPPYIGLNNEFENGHAIEANAVLFDFGRGPCGAKTPSLAHDFSRWTTTSRGPSKSKFLRSFACGLVEAEVDVVH